MEQGPAGGWAEPCGEVMAGRGLARGRLLPGEETLGFSLNARSDPYFPFFHCKSVGIQDGKGYISKVDPKYLRPECEFKPSSKLHPCTGEKMHLQFYGK